MSTTPADSTNVGGQSKPWQRRLAAIFEVCGVYMVGLLIGYLVIQILGIKIVNPIQVLTANPNADLLEMSRAFAVVLLVQYGGILPLAFLVGWWHRRRRLADYGLTTAGKPLSFHLLAGIILFAISSLPARLVMTIDQIVPLGEKAITQQIVFGLDWSDYRFWIFTAVGSYLLVPIVEELFYRAYVQTRLVEDFGAPAAILITAVFFMFSHGQYLKLSVWNVSLIVAGVYEALLWGYVFFRTRSLIAPVIAHALVNVPVRGLGSFVVLAIMLGIAILYRRHIAEEFRKFGALLKFEIPSRVATVLGVIFMTAFAIFVGISQDSALILGIALMIAALILEAIEKRRQKKTVLQPAIP